MLTFKPKFEPTNIQQTICFNWNIFSF